MGRPDPSAVINCYCHERLSIRGVAERLDTTKHQVHMTLLEHGVERRASGGHHRELPPDLGQVPDRVIAEREGITIQAVQYLRYNYLSDDDDGVNDEAGYDLGAAPAQELPDSMYS